jgi:hypothetical protein
MSSVASIKQSVYLTPTHWLRRERPAAHGIIQALLLTHLVGPVSMEHTRTALAAWSLPLWSADTATSSLPAGNCNECLLVIYWSWQLVPVNDFLGQELFLTLSPVFLQQFLVTLPPSSCRWRISQSDSTFYTY